jgi:hypothetical protein
MRQTDFLGQCNPRSKMYMFTCAAYTVNLPYLRVISGTFSCSDVTLFMSQINILGQCNQRTKMCMFTCAADFALFQEQFHAVT